MPLSESEIIAKHVQSLGEAREACQAIGRNADPEYVAPRGHWYVQLRKAMMALEGSARQMSHFRGDARWLKLGILYGKALRAAQAKFVGQNWRWFHDLQPLFENGLRSMADLRDMRTGRLSNSPILPANPSSWLVLPNHKPAMRPPGTVH